MASLASFFAYISGWTTLRAPHAEVQVPKKLIRGLRDPDAFVGRLGEMHQALEDLTGAPCGGHDRLIMAHEHGHYGAMWAWPDGSRGHHIGVPPQSWPNLVAAANRRPVVSALVHELGHVAFGWDHDPPSGRSYFLWGGATEGFATPVGTYTCLRLGAVPAWIDHPDGRQDWATLDDWVNQWINQGVQIRRQGGTGQQSVTEPGHGPGAAIVEAAMFDLLFRHFGSYDPLRTVLREAFTTGRTPLMAGRSEHEKMTDAFVALGRAANLDLSMYLAEWGFDVTDIRAQLGQLPPLVAALPVPRDVNYG